MKLLGIRYTAYASNIDEKPYQGEKPHAYVQRMALAKAEAVRLSSAEKLPILAADTIVTIDGIIIGKPKDREEVKHSIELLSGREHQAVTALCLLTETKNFESISETIIKFREISASEIDAYSLTNEPYGKAGAYAVQGSAATFVDYFLGSYTNVVGLPLLEVQELLKKLV